jgi:protein-disulfide isomerase
MILRALRLPAIAPVVLAAALLAAPAASHAQNVAGPAGSGTHFKDTSSFKLAPGQKAAIIEFEDLECPACAHAAPIVHTAVEHYKIPLMRHDFLIKSHEWSKDAAITARYLQDKVSPELGDQFRSDVFAAQQTISSKDDLAGFTRKWFTDHKQQLPFVMDPSGRFDAEVQADCTMGERIGLNQTPTIVVLAPNGWTQIMDVAQLYTTIDNALAQSPAKSALPVKSAAHRPKLAQK